MPGQRGSETRQKTIALATRWTPDEYRLLTEIADLSGISRAEVLRRLVQRDHRNIIPTLRLTNAILRIGNNVNQIARWLNAGEPVSRNALEQAYRSMLAATIELRS